MLNDYLSHQIDHLEIILKNEVNFSAIANQIEETL